MSNLPKKIKCTCCEEYKAVREPVLQKRIKKAGSLEKLLNTYLCRNCRKEVTDRVVSKLKKAANPDQFTVNKSEFKFVNTTSNIKDEIKFLTTNTCLIPTLALAHKCNDCKFFKKCNVKDSKGNLYKATFSTK